MNKFEHLFEPKKIAGYTFKNRALCAPMVFGFVCLQENAEQIYRITEDKARGGVAEVVIGEMPVNLVDAAIADHQFVKDVDFERRSGPGFDAFRRYADIIKKYDCIASIEIFHAGQNRGVMGARWAKPKTNSWGPVAFVHPNGVIVEAFDESRMKKVCRDFATCTDFMKTAGFDGVLIHGAHGYVFTQFLSPLINLRTDKYGGSIENRGRFPRAILKSIREAAGKDFIVELRIDGSENVPGGQSPDDTADFCNTLEGLVDIVHISGGRHLASYQTHTFSSHYDIHGVNVADAAYIKKKIRIPVTVVGGINSPEYAEQIIAEGKVDFVSLGRQLIADPDFVNKAREGRESEIRRCLRCYHCYGAWPGPRVIQGLNLERELVNNYGWKCSINPVASNELQVDAMPKPQGPRKVLVAGGGPGGMQAAITAFDRGHNVILVDKGSSLGGTLNFTDNDPIKADLRNFKDLLIREVGKRNIKVLLNTEISPGYVKEFKPDALVLAIGASPCMPPIPGIETAFHALEAYKDGLSLGHTVIMVGGGLAGCETAIYLADRGHEIVLIELLDRLASETKAMQWDATFDQVNRRKNIKARTGLKCIEIAPNQVKVTDSSGKIEAIAGDAVVYSLGMDARRREVEAIRASAGNSLIFEVGDCLGAGHVYEAVTEGFSAAMKII
jgi:2,4-dienoyl-CoA reductase-like NADH-dependent reductase (Old Yellow Enzyme family)/thioredoxin reductase